MEGGFNPHFPDSIGTPFKGEEFYTRLSGGPHFVRLGTSIIEA